MRPTLVAVVVLAVTPAHADPDEPVGHPLVLDDGAVELRLTAEINLQPRFVARPLSFASDVGWGISPHWTIGLVHSDASVDRIDAGATACVRESDTVGWHCCSDSKGARVAYRDG